jgi:hypothetical protein
MFLKGVNMETINSYFSEVKNKLAELNKSIEKSPVKIKVHNEKMELVEEIIKLRLIDLIKSDSLLSNQLRGQAIQKFTLALNQIHIDSLSFNLIYANLSIQEWQNLYFKKFEEAKKFVKNNFKYNEYITIPNFCEGTKLKGTSPSKYINFILEVVTGKNPKFSAHEILNLKNGSLIRGYQFTFFKNGNVHIKF